MPDTPTGPASLAGSYVRALLPKASRGAAPDTWTAPSVSREAVTADPEHLRRYRQLCGFAPGPTLPPTYPHLTAFPMAMALMTRRGFPFRVLGLVHVRNEISRLRPIEEREQLDYHVWIDKPVEHPKGVAFDVRVEVCDDLGSLVWSSASTYLCRRASTTPSAAPPAASGGTEADPVDTDHADTGPVDAMSTAPALSAAQAWPLPADLGRRYAALSGDRNPIHLYPWTARPFGFRRQIAHGMWTAARCIAAIDVPCSAEATVTATVDFRAPVPLPSTVAFTRHPAEAAAAPGTDAAAAPATGFTLVSARTGRTHLTGRLALL